MNFSKKRSCSTSYRNHYIPPYERLLRRNRNWKPKKVEQEKQLQKLCQEGILTPFQPPQEYLCYFINEKTEILIVDELIDQAKLSNWFSMDTEDDALSHKPAMLQVEIIRQNLPSIMMIIETQYLPPASSPLFKKIQYLCTIIFTSNNHICSWGPALTELGKFHELNLFNTKININEHDIQKAFSTDQLCSLQSAIKSEFKQYLEKTATLAEWGCGVDFLLGTYVPEDAVGPERAYQIKEEKKYRSILKQYAMNDVFAVTKLIYRTNLFSLLTPPATIELEDISDDEILDDIQQEPSIELQSLNEELIVHAPNELLLNENDFIYNEDLNVKNNIEQNRKISIINETTTLNKNFKIFETILDNEQEQNELYYNESRKVHVQDEPMELQYYNDDSYDPPLPDIMKVHLNDDSLQNISDDELDNQSLPDIMKLHFHKPNHLLKKQNYNDNKLNEIMKVHVRNEPPRVRNSFNLDSTTTTTTVTRKQLKNRQANRRHRAQRYRHEIVRHIYPLFNITKVKQILKSMNIFYVNINIVKHVLFIGLKNKEMVQEVDQTLNGRIFTEQHYKRLYKK